MPLDNPKKREFHSWDSFRGYAERVRHSRRYVWDRATNAFLKTVLATIHERDVELPKGAILFRAQRGVAWSEYKDDDGHVIGEEALGYGRERMKPRTNRATEGRASPAGISILYLATTEKTAISEVRPWIGAAVSVAQFRITRPLRALDLSRGHGKLSIGEISIRQLMGKEKPDAQAKNKAVWVDIDNAFSRPVSVSDDSAEYVPTQILAELFRNAGYDAIIYRSHFGEKGFNVAVFDPSDADPINCAPYEVTAIDVESKEIGNRWFAKRT